MSVGQESLEARAERVHRETTVVDFSVRGMAYQYLRQGGVTGSIVVVNALVTKDIHETMANMTGYYESVWAHRDELTLFKSPDDIRTSKAAGKTGYIFHMQGMAEIGTRLFLVEELARLGARVMAITYNSGNQMGSGCGEPVDTGLTYFGRQVIREMNRVGVVVDLSHLGYRTAREVLEVSSEPCILSHSCPYDLVKNKRNAPADVMKAVAESGGVQGISVYAPLLDPGDGRFPTIETVLDHVDYTVDKLGIDHVSIGTDHSEITDARWHLYVLRERDLMPAYYQQPPYLNHARYHSVEGFQTAADMPKLTRGLVARGYSDEDIKKIMGGNLLRVFDQTWGKKVEAEAPARETA